MIAMEQHLTLRFKNQQTIYSVYWKKILTKVRVKKKRQKVVFQSLAWQFCHTAVWSATKNTTKKFNQCLPSLWCMFSILHISFIEKNDFCNRSLPIQLQVVWDIGEKNRSKSPIKKCKFRAKSLLVHAF